MNSSIARRLPVALCVVTTAAWSLCAARPVGAQQAASVAELPLPVRAGGEGASSDEGASSAEEVSARAVRLPAQLTLWDAFVLALRANKDIRIAYLASDQSESRIMRARGEFDVTVFAEASRGRTNVPVAGVPLGRSDTAVSSMTAGLRQRIVTGTNVELSASNDYSRDLTGASALNPTYAPELGLSVRQDLLKDFGIDINRTDIVVAQNNYEISRQALRDTIIQDLFQVESAYWGLYFAVADLKVREQQLDRAQKLVDRAEAQVGVGEAAPIEITRARSSAASQETAIINARNRITKLRHSLLQLMGILDVDAARLDFELADAPPEELFQTTLDRASQTAREHRPDCRQAELGVDNADLQKRFARNQRLPTLQLFGEYRMAGLGDDLSGGLDEIEGGRFNSWEAGLLFEWPIPNRVARSDYRAATLERRIAMLRLEDVLERATRDVADALDDLRTAEGRITTAQEARELADELLSAEEKSFNLGRSNSLDVLTAQAALAQAERDEIQARTDYATALANLLRTQGNFLEEKGVALLDYRPE